ncbi:MAG: GNAT family N-acetyltransferase [Defluviitaleaceae bacterium]|nr:GNAT family N-acetyltransferase [Defluviitaleaceae bacterium]MCL2261855.1 GNAT family N-acetyltransferase [Defluviitaleaceae bacterium]
MDVRKARAGEEGKISRAIADSFAKIFATFTKDMGRMAKVFENGVAIERFCVAEQDGELIGIVACGCRAGRVLKSTKEECVANLGAVRGRIAFRVIRSELMRPHEYPANVGYIDVLGVLPQARGKGVAKELLNAVVQNFPQYTEFILDVDSANAPAIKSYTDFGFVEYKRVNTLPFINRGKIFMRYTTIS